jgi:hypothetical protein
MNGNEQQHLDKGCKLSWDKKLATYEILKTKEIRCRTCQGIVEG